MRKLLIAVVLTIAGGLAYAGSEKYLSDGPDLTVCEQALEFLSKGDRAGFDVLSEHLLDRSQESNAKVTEFLEVQFPGLQRRIKSLGEPRGVELVDAANAGGSVRRYFYLCKYEHGWIRWRFTFYRPTTKWLLQGCNFADNEDALFAECGHCLLHSDSSETSLAEKPTVTSSR